MMPLKEPINYQPMTQADLIRNGTRIAQRELKSSRDVSFYRSPDSPSKNKLKVVDWPGIPATVLSPQAQRERKLNKERRHRSRSLDREGRSTSLQPRQADLRTMLKGNNAPQRRRSSSLQPTLYGTEQGASPPNSRKSERTQQSTHRSRQSSSRSDRSDRRSHRPSSLRSLAKDNNQESGQHHHRTSSVHLSPTQTHYKNRRYELRKMLSENMERDHWADLSYNSTSTSSGDFSGESQIHTHAAAGSRRYLLSSGPPPFSPRPHSNQGDRKKLSSNRRKSSSSPSSYHNRPPRSPDSSGCTSGKLLSLFASPASSSQLIPTPPRSPVSPKTRPKLRRMSSLEGNKLKKKHHNTAKNKESSSRNDPALETSPSNSIDKSTLEFALSSLRISHWD